MKAHTLNQLIGFANVNPIRASQRKQNGSRYSFDLDQFNQDLDLSDELAKIEISLDPSWQHSSWARTLFFFVIAGLRFGYFCSRISQTRRDSVSKRKAIEFREKEAKYEQLVAETKTAILRLQMNPHFIFNCLNSINSYILQKDIDTASDYLGYFARLMRMILRFADKPFIPLSKEIELLKLYLQTETMRFNKELNFCFELENNLNPDKLVIPTMLLQPLVENAIWHGLSNKKEGEGQIIISFSQEEESLLCSIEDNGIGRVASSQINMKKNKSYESQALSIIEQRIKLLEKEYGVSTSFEIRDLQDVNHKPSGTKVMLRLPLL